MGIVLAPINRDDAKAFVADYHRHNPTTPVTWYCQTSVRDGEQLVGVAIIAKPVARGNDDGLTAEVSRCCTTGTRNACTMLYGAAKRAAQALGYRRLTTYTLASESAASVKAAGFEFVHVVKGREWNCPSRPRLPTFDVEDRNFWRVNL